jgi:hypothetical protein
LVPSIRVFFSTRSRSKAVEAARLAQAWAVSLLSACRCVYVVLLVILTARAKSTSFSCVEFSFNASAAQSKESDVYSSTLYEIVLALFYPIFLLAGKQRNDAATFLPFLIRVYDYRKPQYY